MSSPSDYYKFLEAFACAHVSDGSTENDGDSMLGYFMSIQGSPGLALAEVRELKAKGNDFFRQSEFDIAAACYDEACNLLSLSLGNLGGEDIKSVSDLAVSLLSNMAACALKLEEYRAAAGMCSMILNTFPRNVKALFRRAVAYMKLKRFPLAELDLVEALVVEPNNKDVLRELDVVKGHRLIKDNGKRELEVATQDDMDGTNKRRAHILSSDEDKKDSESVITEVMDDQSEVSMVMDDQSEVSIKEHESVITEMTDAQSICTNTSTIEFSKKGSGSSRLRIPVQSYQKLLDGKEVSFYRKRDLSTLTIRIIQGEVTKEKDTIRELCKKKKKRKRRHRRCQSKMVEDMNAPFTETATLSVIPSCENLSFPGAHILQDNSAGVNGSSASGPVVNEKTTSICSPDHKGSIVHQPFIFSASPKKGKIYSLMRCRYPSHERWRMDPFKKNHNFGDESPRHNLSTSFKSRPLSHKFLRLRGVSVSCFRYSPKVHSIRKRKELSVHLASSDRPAKKPNLVVNPICSLFAYPSNVLIKSQSDSDS